MIGEAQIQNPILPGLLLGADADWQGRLEAAASLGIGEVALFMDGQGIEDRRAAYRFLETTTLQAIPYVQLPPDVEEWEIGYLFAKYRTACFSFKPVEKAYAAISTMAEPRPKILIENPEKKINPALFSNAALQSPGVAGICLDAASLEQARRHDAKTYDSIIDVLDHHTVGAVHIGAVPEHWYQRLTGNERMISSLSDLHYLKHFPATYFTGIIALKLDNLLEEQLELVAYLKGFFRTGV